MSYFSAKTLLPTSPLVSFDNHPPVSLATGAGTAGDHIIADAVSRGLGLGHAALTRRRSP